MSEMSTKHIEIQVFTTPKGDKTCSTSPKENCVFLQTTRFGLELYLLYAARRRVPSAL